MTILAPGSEEEAASLVTDSAAARQPLLVAGNGTKAALGRPVEAATILSAAALSGVTLYEPAEMVIGARAGTPLAMVEAELAARGQMLPFEPMDYRPLLGSSGEPTIGAVTACNLSGPRRIMAGAARDSLIGVRFVNGRGEVVKSGGRVMKNVTGLDLVKLMAGSFGTLGFLTEVIFKVLPRPETEATLVILGLSDRDAIGAMSAALGSPFEVSGAAHLPDGDGGPRTLIRIENFASSVDYRIGELQRIGGRAETQVLDQESSAATWAAIRDAAMLVEPRERAVWRISVAPSRAADLVSGLRRRLECRVTYDLGGGLVWLALPVGDDAGAEAIRPAVRAARGHALLVRAPDALRAAIDVFDPPAAALQAVQAKIKAAHDPAGILSPGRMYAGM